MRVTDSAEPGATRAPGVRLTPRRVAVASGLAILTLMALTGIEKASRYYPSVMPTQWQIYRLAIDHPSKVVPDAELGFSMAPKQHELIRTRDYTFLSETDSKGYPNREPWPDRPALVFLGDSLLVGTGVGLDDEFTTVISKLLPDQPLVNLGLAGAGPERQIRVYRRFAGNWHPHLVVSCLYLASDFDNDVQFLSWLRDGRGSDFDTYRIQVAIAQHPRGMVQRALDRSVILDRTFSPILRWINGREHLETRVHFADGTEILLDRNALAFAVAETSPDDPRLDAFMTALEHLRVVVERSGTGFALMLIPSKEELFGAGASRTRFNLASRLKARLAAASIPVLDLYPALRQRGNLHSPYFPRDMHLNAFGNRIVAEEFAAWLQRQQGGVSK
jgi:acetyltransferase AlgX (SGNH hydrolase-like protein)